MVELRNKRIMAQFSERLFGLIDKSDFGSFPEKDHESILLSRSLAAYSIMMKANINESTATSAIVDGFHDNGIDLIFHDQIENILYFVQSKWIYNGSSTMEVGDLHKFITGVSSIINFDFSDFNEKIVAMQSSLENALTDINCRIKLIVIMTTRNGISTACTKELNKFIASMNDSESEIGSYEIIDQNAIYAHLSGSAGDGTINLDNVIMMNWGTIDSDSRTEAYYGTINAAQISIWWEQYGTKLFDKNIRYFKGETEVNMGMKKTIESDPENFVYFNNGIKIIANKIERAPGGSHDRKVGIFAFKNASIVNGAQTVGSIGEANRTLAEQVSKIKVMAQVISVDNAVPDLEAKITKLSNTQNKIEGKDFTSSDPVQEQLRKDLLLDKIEYIYRSGISVVTLEKNCNIDDATISLGCYYPDINVSTLVKRQIGSIFDNLDKPPYKLIFNSSVTTYLLWNSICIFRTFETISNDFQHKQPCPLKPVSVHGNRMLLHLVFQTVIIRYTKLENEYLNFDAEFIIYVKKLYSDLVEKIFNSKMQLYPESYWANVFKNSTKCKSIKDNLH